MLFSMAPFNIDATLAVCFIGIVPLSFDILFSDLVFSPSLAAQKTTLLACDERDMVGLLLAFGIVNSGGATKTASLNFRVRFILPYSGHLIKSADLM